MIFVCLIINNKRGELYFMVIIAGCGENFNLKRSTPTFFQKKTKKVRGFVDRVSNGIVVVVIKDPEDPECVKEIYVPVSKFPKHVPEEGEYVSVTINQ